MEAKAPAEEAYKIAVAETKAAYIGEERYKEAMASAWANYEAVRLPAFKRYTVKMEIAWKEHQKRMKEAAKETLE